MATNKTKLKFMTPTKAQQEHEEQIKNKLIEWRTGTKQNALRKKTPSTSIALRKKTRPLKETLNELQQFISSYLNHRKSV